MLGPLRTLVSVAFLVVVLWAAFTVRLGDRTFADHVDRIGETEEAKALLDGARGRVRPALEEVKQRVLGEYVEAPTFVPAGGAIPPRGRPAVMTVQQPAEAAKVVSGALGREQGAAQRAESRAGAAGEERELPGRRRK